MWRNLSWGVFGELVIHKLLIKSDSMERKMVRKRQNKQANKEIRMHKRNRFCMLKLKLTFLSCWTFFMIKSCCCTWLAVFLSQFIITFGTRIGALLANTSRFRTSVFAVCTFTTKHNFVKGKLNRELNIEKKAVFDAFALPQSLKEIHSHQFEHP